MKHCLRFGSLHLNVINRKFCSLVVTKKRLLIIPLSTDWVTYTRAYLHTNIRWLQSWQGFYFGELIVWLFQSIKLTKTLNLNIQVQVRMCKSVWLWRCVCVCGDVCIKYFLFIECITRQSCMLCRRQIIFKSNNLLWMGSFGLLISIAYQ